MPIIIDSWNLIKNFASPINYNTISKNKIFVLQQLKTFLETFIVKNKETIIAVVDSINGYFDMNLPGSSTNLKFVSTEDADRYIKRYIDNYQIKKNLTVISSDKSVYFYARDSGCKVLKSEDFWIKLGYKPKSW